MKTEVTVHDEFRVNTYTAGDQYGPFPPAITALANGGFIVTWYSDGQDGSGSGIYGQRYDADGQPAGQEFRINSYTANDQGGEAVTALANGGFVVTWNSSFQDGSHSGIYGQRYDADGQPAGQEFRINSYTANDQGGEAVTALANGGFVVTWDSWLQDGSSHGIYGQRYDADGQPAGQEFRINSYTASDQAGQAVTALANGGFVITWHSFYQDGSLTGVYGQRYDADGQPAGQEFRINSYTTAYQDSSVIKALADGGFVVSWNSFGQDGSDYGVYGQRYDADGQPAGQEFRINSYAAGRQLGSTITALADGGFVVSWNSFGQDGSDYGVYGQRYDADGQPAGHEFRINSYTADRQYQYPFAVTALADGGFVATWNSDGQDGSGWGVYGRIYSIAEINHAPTLALLLDDRAASEDTPFTFTLPDGAFADADGDSLTYTASLHNGEPLPDWLKFDPATHTFSGAPGQAQVGEFAIKVTASDGTASVSDSFKLTINEVNDNPVITIGSPLTMGADVPEVKLTSAHLSVSDSDSPIADLLYHVDDLPDAGELLFKGVALAAGATFTQADIDNGLLTFRPSASSATTDSFAVSVSDGEGGSATATVNIALAEFDHVQSTSQYGGWWGTSGRDFLKGSANADNMTGGAGSDVISGEGGNDQMNGQDGNDRMFGGAGNDTMTGDNGNDLLDGGDGVDTIYAGANNDIVTGGKADGDRLWGDSGDDTFLFRRGDGKDQVMDFRTYENDIIDLRDFAGVLGGIKSFEALKAAGMVESPQYGGDTVIKLTATDWITIKYINASQLTSADFLF